ncbi:putative C6 transcription factor, partial [Paraphoma chrysanthemicola]
MPLDEEPRNRSRSPRDTLRGTSPSRRIRKRNHIACDACRARRTRCDSARPSCSYCSSHGIECQYPDAPSQAPSRVELELGTINERLDHLTNLLTAVSNNAGRNQMLDGVSPRQDELEILSDEEKAPFELLGSRSMMQVLGLGPEFITELVMLERAPPTRGLRPPSRFCIVQTEQAINSLAAFSAHVHIWYPIFRVGFSEKYLHTISGPLVPSADSCIVLLVAAIGSWLQSDRHFASELDSAELPFVEAALSSMPMILTELSLSSIQCFILLSIYNCCLLRPCQAHDYALIASFKIQNLLKRSSTLDNETRECLARAYWAVLLLESELSNHFDVPRSGIWSLDEHVSLPDGRDTWSFEQIATPSSNNAISPSSIVSGSQTSSDTVDAYFLAEISMRRMLHRCNTAIRRTSEGSTVYAPRIATELIRQLDEWHTYLPASIQFSPVDQVWGRECPHIDFLYVQYHCYKISTYWPAAYQAFRDHIADDQLIEDCRRLLESYISCIPRLIGALKGCVVNSWTLFATMFMSSMAVLKIVCMPWLQAAFSPRLFEVLELAGSTDTSFSGMSPSIDRMHEALRRELATTYNPFEGRTILVSSPNDRSL